MEPKWRAEREVIDGLGAWAVMEKVGEWQPLDLGRCHCLENGNFSENRHYLADFVAKPRWRGGNTRFLEFAQVKQQWVWLVLGWESNRGPEKFAKMAGGNGSNCWIGRACGKLRV